MHCPLAQVSRASIFSSLESAHMLGMRRSCAHDAPEPMPGGLVVLNLKIERLIEQRYVLIFTLYTLRYVDIYIYIDMYVYLYIYIYMCNELHVFEFPAWHDTRLDVHREAKRQRCKALTAAKLKPGRSSGHGNTRRHRNTGTPAI